MHLKVPMNENFFDLIFYTIKAFLEKQIIHLTQITQETNGSHSVVCVLLMDEGGGTYLSIL